MGFSHSARSLSVRSVRRWIRISRSRALLALSACGLIAGRKPVKFRPLLRAPRVLKAYPRKVNEVCSCLASIPTVFAVDDPRLVRVQLESNLVHPRGDLVEHVLCLTRRLAVHDRVVGVALERTAREVPGHPDIERVVHEQVRQDRRDRRPLRSASAALLKGAVWVLERGSQPPLHVQQHPRAVGDRLDRADHEVPGDGVEGRHDTLPTSMASRRRSGSSGGRMRGRAGRLS